MKKLKHIDIYSNNRLIGHLTKDSIFNLSYKKDIEKEEKYKENQLNELSFSLNYIANRNYKSSSLSKFPFLTTSLPEGFMFDLIKEDFKKNKNNIDFEIDDMFLLAFFGDDQIGRLSFKTQDAMFNDFLSNRKEKINHYSHLSLSTILKGNSNQTFEYILNDYLKHFSLQERTLQNFTSLAGYQPKISLLLENKQNLLDNKYIIKSFSSKSFEHLSLNEFICMSIAQHAGIDTPNFYLSDDQKLFIIERFDFLDNENKYGVEDFCSIRGLTNDKKYQSNYNSLLKTMELFNSSEVEKLFKYIALSALVKNGDAHLKNFSLLYTDCNNIKLSPLYDVVNTRIYPMSIDKFGKTHYDDFAMPLKQGKSKEFPLNNELIMLANEFNINGKMICEEIEESKYKILKEYKYLFQADFFKKFTESLNFNFSFNLNKIYNDLENKIYNDLENKIYNDLEKEIDHEILNKHNHFSLKP